MKKLMSCVLVVLLGLTGRMAQAETYAENTTVSGEALSLAVGEVLDFDVNAGVTVTVSRVISGEGVLRKTGMGVLHLESGNSFTGGVELVAGELWANAEGALGTGPVVFTSNAQTTLLAFNSSNTTFANDIRFKVVPRRISTTRGSLEFRANTRLTGTIYGPRSANDWIVFGVCYVDGLAHARNSSAVFDGDICFEGDTYGALRLNGYGTMTFNGKVLARQLSFVATWSASGTFVFNNSDSQIGATSVSSYCPTVIYGADNIFTNMDLVACYNYRSEVANAMDLNGHDQSFCGFRVNPAKDSSYPLPVAPNDGYGLQIKSATPATLTLTGYGADKCTDTYHAFNGALSVVLNADSAYTLNLTNRTHHLTGALIVSNGTLRATGTTSFPDLRRVAVAAGATLAVTTTTANAFASCAALDVEGAFSLSSSARQSFGHAAVTLSENASLTLPEGALLLAKSLVVNGEAKGEGYYTSDEIPQLKSGRIRVSEQLWPELVEPVYTLNVPAGVTNGIAELTVQVTQDGSTTVSPFSELAAPTAGTLRKVGAGVVQSSQALKDFKGQILVEEGGFAVNDNLQAGPQDRATAPVVWVKKGASFILYGTSTTCGSSKLMLKNSFHLSGEGLNGLGAIDLETDSYQNYAFTGCGTWFLDGDTRVGGYSVYRVDLYNTTLDMKGNRLEFKRPEDRTSYFSFYFDALTIKNAGDIWVNGANFVPQGGVTWAQDAPSTVTFTNQAYFGFWNSVMKETHSTTLKFSSGNNTTWTIGGGVNDDSRVTPGVIKQGYWDGPVQIDGQLRIDGTYDQKGAALRGKVSGAGNLLMRSGWLHLTHAENDFSGTLGVSPPTYSPYLAYERGLVLYANGALPLSCAYVGVTNSPMVLMDAATFDLPTITFQVPVDTNQTFSATESVTGGTLAGLQKVGAGTLTYAVPLAVTGTVEVAEGTLALFDVALTAGTLALGGGTIQGDVTVTQRLAFASSAVADGALQALAVEGAVTFAAGATLDLDALVDGAYALSPRYGDFPILRASDGVTGTPRVDPNSAAYRAGWRCGVVGGVVYALHHKGTSLYFR